MRTTTGERRQVVELTADNQALIVRVIEHLILKGEAVMVNGWRVEPVTPCVKACKNGSVAWATKAVTTGRVKTAYAKCGSTMTIVVLPSGEAA
mgnify:CR=1 FL=1